MNPFTSFKVYPNYWSGFDFTWTIDPVCMLPHPWTFIVQESETPYSNFHPISSSLINIFRYSENRRRIVPPEDMTHFRVMMFAGSQSFTSDVIDPIWQLSRQDFLIVRKLLRDEYIGMHNMAGIPIGIWIKSVFGPRCSACTDPITHDVINPSCIKCFGTGRLPGYYGPFESLSTVAPRKRQKGLQGDNIGPSVSEQYEVRLPGFAELKKEDIIIETATDRHYYVDVVTMPTEMRRVPVIQNVTLIPIPTTDSTYRLGHAS